MMRHEMEDTEEEDIPSYHRTHTHTQHDTNMKTRQRIAEWVGHKRMQADLRMESGFIRKKGIRYRESMTAANQISRS